MIWCRKGGARHGRVSRRNNDTFTNTNVNQG